MANNTSKTFSVYKHEEDEKMSQLSLNPFCKSKIEGYYKRKTKGGLIFFSIRKKDLYCYGQELGGEYLAFPNSDEFVLLKNGKMNLYSIDGFRF